MPDSAITDTQLTVRILSRGSLGQLREAVEHADREQARQIHCELVRLSHVLARKYDFGKGNKDEKGEAGVK